MSAGGQILTHHFRRSIAPYREPDSAASMHRLGCAENSAPSPRLT